MICATVLALAIGFAVWSAFSGQPAADEAFPKVLNVSGHCSDEDRDYADLFENCYDPEDAYKFGVPTKLLVANRDLAGLYDLVYGELLNGPKRSVVENCAFYQVSTEEWRNLVLRSKPPCRPVGWRGFMLGYGMIWFDFPPVFVFDDLHGHDVLVDHSAPRVIAINRQADEDCELASVSHERSKK